VGFFLRADVRRGTVGGAEQPGDNQVTSDPGDDNDITLWPRVADPDRHVEVQRPEGRHPGVSLSGWNSASST